MARPCVLTRLSPVHSFLLLFCQIFNALICRAIETNSSKDATVAAPVPFEELITSGLNTLRQGQTEPPIYLIIAQPIAPSGSSTATDFCRISLQTYNPRLKRLEIAQNNCNNPTTWPIITSARYPKSSLLRTWEWHDRWHILRLQDAFTHLSAKKVDGPWLEVRMMGYKQNPIPGLIPEVLWYACRRKARRKPTENDWWLISMDGHVIEQVTGDPPQGTFNETTGFPDSMVVVETLS